MSLRLEHVTYTYSPGSVYETHALRMFLWKYPPGSFWGLSDIQEAENPH